jgi:hypothetical protein
MKLVRTHNMSTFSSMLSADWEIDGEAQAKSAAKQVCLFPLLQTEQMQHSRRATVLLNCSLYKSPIDG